MAIIKKISIGLAVAAFGLTLAVTSSEAQRRHWAGDGCPDHGVSRSYGRSHDRSYSRDYDRRSRVVSYRSYPRYTTSYSSRSYVSYPRYSRSYVSYPRYSRSYSPYYTSYNSYRSYPRYRRQRGLSISFGVGW